MRPTKALQHFIAVRAHVHGTIKIPGTPHPTARRPHGAGRPSADAALVLASHIPLKKVTT
jgi:hypothetical protein